MSRPTIHPGDVQTWTGLFCTELAKRGMAKGSYCSILLAPYSTITQIHTHCCAASDQSVSPEQVQHVPEHSRQSTFIHYAKHDMQLAWL